MTKKIDPIRPTDDEARALARDLISGARFAALAVLLPDGMPHVSRVALATAPDGGPVTLISSLAVHSQALTADPRCSLMVGEPGAKGDPLTHPRLTLQARARFISRDSDDHGALRADYLQKRPKAALYADFADFSFVRFEVAEALLNGGFGKAYRLTPEDLAP
ncbi:MAG: HugZ family protein [Rhodobacteraceae bacterium]|nr:HugZ family protein [Paracoccaceae bacterium]